MTYLVRADDFVEQGGTHIPWVMEPFAVSGSVVMLYGHQGIGKSRILWQLGHALATGGDWLGFRITKPGTVAYLNLDMSREEARKMMRDAKACGLTAPNMYTTPTMEDINVLLKKDAQKVADWLMEVDAYHVIVDTGKRAYRRNAESDLNEEISNVVKFFQMCVPEGMGLFSHHNRKRSGRQSEEEFEKDDDSFSGGVQWEASVTSSLKLTKRSGQLRLYFKKCRLDNPLMESLSLVQDPKTGFFQPVHDYRFDLRTWPAMVPPEQRFEPATEIEVFREISERRGDISIDAVKKHFQRTKEQVRYDWHRRLTEEQAALNGARDKGQTLEKLVPNLSGEDTTG